MKVPDKHAIEHYKDMSFDQLKRNLQSRILEALLNGGTKELSADMTWIIVDAWDWKTVQDFMKDKKETK